MQNNVTEFIEKVLQDRESLVQRVREVWFSEFSKEHNVSVSTAMKYVWKIGRYGLKQKSQASEVSGEELKEYLLTHSVLDTMTKFKIWYYRMKRLLNGKLVSDIRPEKVKTQKVEVVEEVIEKKVHIYPEHNYDYWKDNGTEVVNLGTRPINISFSYKS